MSTTTARIALIPRDGFFCKDGRGWFTSATGRGHALDWPYPSTLLGALRARWGRSFEARGNTLSGVEWREQTAGIRLGRTLALRRDPGGVWQPEHRVWPVPADARWLEGHADVFRLDPAPSHVPTLGRDDDAAREALWTPVMDHASKPIPPPRWWRNAEFTAWLSNSQVAADSGHIQLATRVQTRIELQPDALTPGEGMIFSHDVLETLEPDAEWAMGCEVLVPDALPFGPVTLGSDSRLAAMETLPQDLFAPPSQLVEAMPDGSRGLRLITVTPTAFERGWLPDGMQVHDREYRGTLRPLDGDVVLRAAFVQRPVHVSGWDMVAGKPKATSRMVPRGSVYFFERPDGRPFTSDDVRALWLAAVGDRTDEGFGRVVAGTWHPRGT